MNSTAREQILARVRAATADVQSPIGARGPVPIIEAPAPGRREVLELFAENVADYRAVVVKAAADDLATVIADALTRLQVTSVVVPAGLDENWLSGATVHRVHDHDLDAQALDGIDGVVTGARLGIATTGTIVLDHGPGQGRRALSLIPDVHVCVVRADQVVHDVPEGVARLAEFGSETRPLTWISGPSATSDIELDRVEGVHGPRKLVMVLVD